VAKKHIIFGVHITDRIHHAGEVQALLTEYGCNIKTRLGLHEVSETACSPNGLLILEMFGDEARCEELAHKLTTKHNVEVKKMVFEHP
jgi:hypothetical protein